MLPSYGLFAEIGCPFLKRGLCERPHCLFKHDKEGRDMFDTSYKPPVVQCLGIQHYQPSDSRTTEVNAEAKDDCLQELERINKEIETVKNEVEQEQKRLSLYQTEQGDCGNAASKRPRLNTDTTSKNVNGYTPSKKRASSPKRASQASKYVVDNCKPRTDLEYDPLSNFSAGFRACGSSGGKELKAKSGPGGKRAREAVFNQPTAHLDRELSPEELEGEEGVLVIDLPSSPERKRSHARKPCVKPQKMVETSTETQTTTVRSQETLLNPQFVRREPSPILASAMDEVNDKYCSETPTDKPSAYVNRECGNNFDIFDNLSRCLEDLRSESDMVASSGDIDPVENTLVIDLESPTGTSEPFPKSQDQVVEETHFCSTVKLSPSEPAYRIEEIDPAQPKRVEEATFPHYNTTMASSLYSSNQFTHHNEQAAQHMVPNYWSTVESVPSYPLPCQKMAELSSAFNISPSSYLEQLSASEPSTTVQEQPSVGGLDSKDVILVDSASEEELNCDVELSDSDPMEECYRIFMEARREEAGAAEPPGIPSSVERPAELKVKPQAVPGQKRVAHVTRHTEPTARARPQPQVLVPLRGLSAPGPTAPGPSGGPQASAGPSRSLQVQQKASALTAAVRGAQAYVSIASQSRPSAVAAPPPREPANQQVPAAYVNCLPVGTAVIQVGNNLHFILPESSYPLPIASIATPVSSVLTPVTPLHLGPAAPLQAPSVAASPVQRYRPAAPAHAGGFAGSGSASSAPQGPVHVPAKPLPTKRKFKQRPDGVKDRVPHDVRQRYVNMFTEEFLKTSGTVNEAFEKALAEETAVYNRSINKLKYLSVAVNALKKLKNQSAAPAKDEHENGMKRSKGQIPLNLKKLKQNGDAALYDSLKEYVLTEEKLIENNYPLHHPEKPGSAVLFADNKKSTTDRVSLEPLNAKALVDLSVTLVSTGSKQSSNIVIGGIVKVGSPIISLKRTCCRCGATYSVSRTGKHTRQEECNYHYGKGVKHRVPGGVETRYSCCEGVMGAPGCQVFKLHVHDALSLDGFVSTGAGGGFPGVFAVDCEMCYATDGLELSRVTVVNSSLQVVYDTFVRPSNEVIDYNTRFSGICEEDVKDISTSITEVQNSLLSFISNETILIGHGLETNLCALKLLHGIVVDTSVVFPHRLGPPHKLTLNNLTAEHLRRIIQDSVCGHDTADDATACMELMLWKVKEDGKGRRW